MSFQNIIGRLLTVSALFFVLSTIPGEIKAEKWVRIKVTEDGLYGISYTKLREMGFSDPSKVGVAGIGCQQLPMIYEETKISDYIQPVIHQNNTLYFYGDGPENISFVYNSGESNSGHFKNKGRNVYSDYGYYYLTDSPDFLKVMEDSPTTDETADATSWGVGYIHHEQDLYQNNTFSGNLFWGEKFNGIEPSSRSWDIELPEGANESPASLDICFYSEKGTIGSINFSSSGGSGSLDGIGSTTSNLNPLSIPLQSLPVAAGKEKITIGYSSSDNPRGIANLDYWTLSYRCNISDLSKLPNGTFALPNISAGRTSLLNCNNVDNYILIDLTDINNPKKIKSSNSDNGFYVSHSSQTPIIYKADLTQTLPTIEDWETINGNPWDSELASLIKNGGDLIIITTPEFEPTAKEIAEIHKIYDGISSIIVRIEDIYQHFSYGLPDPESYRRMINYIVKEGEVKPSNLLLVGPVTNNIRSREKNYGYANRHIIPQAPAVHFERGTYPLFDYFVTLQDSPNLAKLENENIELGVGTLPFNNQEDAKRYINKLKAFICDQTHSYHINEWLFVGGTGDEHTHDLQCVTLREELKSATDNSLMISVVAVDAYGNEDARKKFIEGLNEGKAVTLYFGHAGNLMFGKDPRFFTNEDIKSLNNSYLTFIITAGCTSTSSDLGKRGMGEEFVLGTEAGAIGGIISMRETWAGQNYDFVNTFLHSWAQNNAAEMTPTIGEIYKKTKNLETNTNDNALVLFCDPALRFPLRERSIEISTPGEVQPGSNISLKGKINLQNGHTDSDFEGTIVVKMTEPEITLRSNDYYTAGTNGETVLDVTYGENITTISTARVKEGEFEINLTVPECMEAFKGEKSHLYFSAVNDEGIITAHTRRALSCRASSATSDIKSDVTPPLVEDIWTDFNNQFIYTRVSDETALDLSLSALPAPVRVSLDGVYNRYFEMTPISIEEGGKNIVLRASIPQLTEGLHDFEITVRDMAGNYTSRSHRFEIKPVNQTITLLMEETAASGSCSFRLENAPRSCDVLIYDRNGRLINSLSVSNGHTSWDCKDSNGNKVEPGLFTAVALERSTGRYIRKQSKTIYVPVM